MKMWNRLLGVLGSALLCVGCATSGVHTGPDADLRQAVQASSSSSVEAADGSFGVAVPSGWRVSEGDDEGVLVMMRGETQHQGVITVRSFVTDIQLDENALRSIQEGALEGLRREMPSLAVVSQREQVVAGRRIYSVRYDSRLRGEAAQGIFSLTYDSTGLYSVNAVSLASAFSETERGVGLILRTLQGKKAPSSAVSSVYRAPEDRFSFVVPSGWRFDEVLPSPQLSFHRFEAADGSQSRMLITEYQQALGGEALEAQGVEAIEKGLFALLKAEERELVLSKAVELGGRDAIQRQWQYKSAGEWYYLNSVTQLSEEGVTTLVVVGPHAWQDAQQPAFEQLVRTFAFGAEPLSPPMPGRVAKR